MPNELDSLERSKSAQASLPLATSGPFVAVTPTVLEPDPWASTVFYATVRKDLETRGQQSEAS
jgi:hypothetical protein